MGRCNGCNKAIYCSHACQTEHWLYHAQTCTFTIGGEEREVNFHQKFFNGQETIIGRGGRGVAFMNPNYPGIVIKKANNVDICRGNNEEYATIKEIASTLEHLKFGLISLIQVHNYVIDDFLQCYLVMDHVQKPRHSKVSKTLGSIQFYLGESNFTVDRPGRGEYMGRNQFLETFGKMFKITDLVPVCKDLGRFIASIHFIAQYDGVDLEYIVGYLKDDTSHLHIVAIDFDLCKKVVVWNTSYDGGVTQCAWSLISEPYYPHYDLENPNEKHYMAFKQGYMEVAIENHKEDLAKNIFQEFDMAFN